MNLIEHSPELYHLTIGPHHPQLNINSEQRIRVSIPDCDGLDKEAKSVPDEKFEKHPLTSIPHANPLVGPYYIEGAGTEDSLAVHIHRVEPDRCLGRTGISAKSINIQQKHFCISGDKDFNAIVPHKLFRWNIDMSQKNVSINFEKSKKNIQIPVSPFLGCIAVAPRNGQFIDCLAAGNYGGNIDVPMTVAGSIIYMPVFAKGAYLFLGDMHARQGDGEIIGGAIETSGIVEFSVSIIKSKPIIWPRIENAECIGVITAAGSLEESIQIGYAELTLWLASEYGFDRWEALNLISQTGTARPGSLKTAVCCIDKSFIK
jgi:acetamidase/formamidase